MRFSKNIVLITLLAFVTGILGALSVTYFTASKTQQPSHTETAFERVIRTGTLRCGYAIWDPILMPGKDGQKLTGIFYDFTEKLGLALSLKVEWSQEVSYATFAQDLEMGKIDVMCAGIWPLSARSRVMDFTDSLFYIPIRLYVRIDDMRFDKDYTQLNNENITFGSIDGWASAGTVKQHFPKAKIQSLPDNVSWSEVYEMLATGKIDVIANDIFSSENYMKSNPGKIREVIMPRPLNFFANTYAVKKGEHNLANMLNAGIRDLTNNGITEEILQRYETVPNTLLRPADPYRGQ